MHLATLALSGSPFSSACHNDAFSFALFFLVSYKFNKTKIEREMFFYTAT